MKERRKYKAHGLQAQRRRHEQWIFSPAVAPPDLPAPEAGNSQSDYEARVWHESRRDAHAATRKQKAAIREQWRAWPGPATVLSYRYIVDLHTGAIGASPPCRLAVPSRNSHELN